MPSNPNQESESGNTLRILIKLEIGIHSVSPILKKLEYYSIAGCSIGGGKFENVNVASPLLLKNPSKNSGDVR